MNNKTKTDMSYNAQKVSKLKLISSKLNAQNLVNYFSLLIGGALIVLMLGLVTLLVPPARDNAKATGKHYSVHIVAGQSNALGYGGRVDQLTSDSADQNIKLYFRTNTSSSFGELIKLQPQALDTSNSNSPKVFGPEMSLARRIYHQGNNNVLIIKTAVSGTGMDYWNSTNGVLYSMMITEIRQALTKVQSNGDTYSIDGFYWMQGEADTLTNTLAVNYEQNLRNFISSTRRDLNNSKLPFIVGRIYCPGCGTPANRDLVRNAEVRIGDSYPYVRWVNTDDLVPLYDTIGHYTGSSQLTLGNRFFKEISPFMQAKYPRLIPSRSYTDVSNTSYYKPALDWSVDRRIIFPNSSTEFKPNEYVSRAKLVQFLWRMQGSPVVRTRNNFADVVPTANYAPALDWAKKEGIIYGDGSNKFYPDYVATKQQFIDFLWKYTKSKSPNPSVSLLDVSRSSSFKPAIDWSLRHNIATATSTGYFAPTTPVTRWQAAYFMYNLAKNEEAWLDRNAAPASVLF